MVKDRNGPFLIEVIKCLGRHDGCWVHPYYKNRIAISKYNYIKFLKSAKKVGVYENLRKNILAVCGICGSFVIKTKGLYLASIEIDDNPTYDTDTCPTLCDFVDKILERVILTDKEWMTFLTEGYLKDGEFIYEDDWDNPVWFIREECVIIFDRECNCVPVFLHVKTRMLNEILTILEEIKGGHNDQT